MTRVLAIETSCDETAVAILDDRQILADIIASQDEIHRPFGGIVPELASRRHIEILPTLVEQALADAKISIDEIDAFVATRAPGLIGCLLVGLNFTKSLALATGKSFFGVNHLEGHVLAPMLFAPELHFPFIGVVVSGGHTSLYLARALGDYALLGATRDDAAGEAYDKVAKLLGLGFPGGPAIDKLAARGDPRAVRFPRPKMGTGSRFEIGPYDFSFSGLKTAVSHVMTQSPPPTIADICAGFQHRVVEEIVSRVERAATEYHCSQIVISGGVAANRGLRARLETISAASSLEIFVPPLRTCTDNAVMIAWAGAQHLARGETHPLSVNASAVEELSQLRTAF